MDKLKFYFKVFAFASSVSYFFFNCSNSTEPQLSKRNEPESVKNHSLVINGKHGIELFFEEMTTYYGTCDSIIKYNPNEHCVTYFEPAENSEFWYYKNIHFERSGNRVVFYDVSFRDGYFVEIDGKRWDHNTTYDEVARFFPKSAKECQEQEKQEIKEGTRTKDGRRFIRVHYGGDDYIVFNFQDGLLVGMDFFIPC